MNAENVVEKDINNMVHIVVIIVEFVLICVIVGFIRRYHNIIVKFKHKERKEELDALKAVYSSMMKLAEKHGMDEEWFRESMKTLSDGVFSCYAQGKYLRQEKECQWGEIYDLLKWLPYSVATIKVKVTREDFRNIEGKYKLIDDAVEQGWIRVDAENKSDEGIQLFQYLKCDYGDEDGFGAECVNMNAIIDRDGHFITPFREI